MINFGALQLKIEEKANMQLEKNPEAHFEDLYIDIAIEESQKLPAKEKFDALKEMVKTGDADLANAIADMDLEDSIQDLATEVIFRKLT